MSIAQHLPFKCTYMQRTDKGFVARSLSHNKYTWFEVKVSDKYWYSPRVKLNLNNWERRGQGAELVKDAFKCVKTPLVGTKNWGGFIDCKWGWEEFPGSPTAMPPKFKLKMTTQQSGNSSHLPKSWTPTRYLGDQKKWPVLLWKVWKLH